MCWGDVKLSQTSTWQEHLEFNEKETKTRSGSNPWNVRAIASKMFAVPSNEKCPAAPQSLSLFSGAVISGGYISVAINTLIHTLSVR